MYYNNEGQQGMRSFGGVWQIEFGLPLFFHRDLSTTVASSPRRTFIYVKQMQ